MQITWQACVRNPNRRNTCRKIVCGTLLLTAFAGCATQPALPLPTPEQAAEQLFDAKQPSETLQAYNAVLARDPANARALAHRAALYSSIGRNDLARLDIDRAIALDRNSNFAYCVRALIDQHDKNEDVVLSDATQAITLLQKPASANTSNPAFAVLDATDRGYVVAAAFTLRAEIRKRRKQYEAALADADAVIDFDAEMTSALMVRASIERAQARFPAALEDDLKAIAFPDHSVEVSLSLCSDYAALGPLDRALRKCNEAVTLFPRDARGYMDRGVIFLKTGQLSRARADFGSVLQLYPTHANATFGRGLARKAIGDVAAGQQDMSRAAKTDPEAPIWFAARGVKIALGERT